MKLKGSNLFTDSDKEIGNVAYSGLSLTPEGCLATGFDDQFWRSDELTVEERQEIADYMTERWQTWAKTGPMPLPKGERP